jgi:dynein heavy chain
MHLEEFKNIQDAATSKLFYKLKGEWVNQLISIIKTEFQGVGKGWFNMKETSKVTYDFGKLKRFLTVVRLVMQDTLLSLMKSRQREFVDYFDSFIP